MLRQTPVRFTLMTLSQSSSNISAALAARARARRVAATSKSTVAMMMNLDKPIHFHADAGVRLLEERLGAGLTDLRNHVVAGLLVDVGDRHFRALARERHDDRPSDPHCAAGDGGSRLP